MPQPLRERIPVREVAQGRWPGILARFGLTDKQLSGKHTACPVCFAEMKATLAHIGTGAGLLSAGDQPAGHGPPRRRGHARG